MKLLPCLTPPITKRNVNLKWTCCSSSVFSQPFLHSKGKGLCIDILKRICMTLLGMGKWSESPYTANIILIKAWHLFSCSLEQTACCLELEIWKAEELPTVQRECFVLLLFKTQLSLQTSVVVVVLSTDH